jgi:hypothetical protein
VVLRIRYEPPAAGLRVLRVGERGDLAADLSAGEHAYGPASMLREADPVGHLQSKYEQA